MIKQIKYFIIIFVLIFLSNCSFDNKTGIWGGSEDEKRKISEIEKEQKKIINTKQIYSSENIFLEEMVLCFLIYPFLHKLFLHSLLL